MTTHQRTRLLGMYLNLENLRQDANGMRGYLIDVLSRLRSLDSRTHAPSCDIEEAIGYLGLTAYLLMQVVDELEAVWQQDMKAVVAKRSALPEGEQ